MSNNTQTLVGERNDLEPRNSPRYVNNVGKISYFSDYPALQIFPQHTQPERVSAEQFQHQRWPFWHFSTTWHRLNSTWIYLQFFLVYHQVKVRGQVLVLFWYYLHREVSWCDIKRYDVTENMMWKLQTSDSSKSTSTFTASSMWERQGVLNKLSIYKK